MTDTIAGPSSFYRCWTVKCKTEGCNYYLFLDIVGPRNRALHAVQPRCKSFKIACPECRVEHLYGQTDLEEHNLDTPSGYCKALRDAIG
jgi:hypothetical protein